MEAAAQRAMKVAGSVVIYGPLGQPGLSPTAIGPYNCAILGDKIDLPMRYLEGSLDRPHTPGKRKRK